MILRLILHIEDWYNRWRWHADFKREHDKQAAHVRRRRQWEDR